MPTVQAVFVDKPTSSSLQELKKVLTEEQVLIVCGENVLSAWKADLKQEGLNNIKAVALYQFMRLVPADVPAIVWMCCSLSWQNQVWISNRVKDLAYKVVTLYSALDHVEPEFQNFLFRKTVPSL